jgi:serine/threonine protein kinase
MPLREDNVWWLVHPNSKQVVAAYEDPKYGTLREVPLPKCIEIWGWDGMGGGSYDDSSAIDEVLEKLSSLKHDVTVDGVTVSIPRIPPKYVKWLRSRRSIYREISNMRKLGSHPNVIKLHEVLELIQDSKSTLFLVLEVVTGGELFDRIKIGCGTTEDMARRYFRQLLSGVGCCHARGVCHRDLKPENLLLADGSEGAVLKIADFGLSAAFAIAAGTGDMGDEAKVPSALPPLPSQNMRRLRSVVGSPHYIAPEVTTESVQVRFTLPLKKPFTAPHLRKPFHTKYRSFLLCSSINHSLPTH